MGWDGLTKKLEEILLLCVGEEYKFRYLGLNFKKFYMFS
jgi:hypothetical protein